MIDRVKRRKSIPRVRLMKASPAEAVGYGRPPRAHQFQPGKSGNPKGRPKGAKNEATILTELLHRKIPVREGGKVRKITVLEAILLRFTEDSLKGNIKSAAFLLNRHSTIGPNEAQQPDVSQDDQEILAAFAGRLLNQRANQ